MQIIQALILLFILLKKKKKSSLSENRTVEFQIGHIVVVTFVAP